MVFALVDVCGWGFVADVKLGGLVVVGGEVAEGVVTVLVDTEVLVAFSEVVGLEDVVGRGGGDVFGVGLVAFIAIRAAFGTVFVLEEFLAVTLS